MKNLISNSNTKFRWIGSNVFIFISFLLAHSTLLIMLLITFPVINNKLGTKAFDLKPFGYSINDALTMLQNIDQFTINLYLFPQLFLLDLIYPIALALFLYSVTVRLSIILRIESNLFIIIFKLTPFIAMISDYVENILISLLLLEPTKPKYVVIKIASIATQTKTLFTSISWLLILILIVIWLLRKNKNSI